MEKLLCVVNAIPYLLEIMKLMEVVLVNHQVDDRVVYKYNMCDEVVEEEMDSEWGLC